LDGGAEIFAWIGKRASIGEKKNAMQYAQKYLVNQNRPSHLPLSRILEGGENEFFESLLA
jgi:gelsolin